MSSQAQIKYWRQEAEKYRKMYDERVLSPELARMGINRKVGQTLYAKKGRKYVPVSDPYAYDGLREGWWLVGIKQGSTTIRECIYPDKAPIVAACRDMEEKIMDVIRKASEARPAKGIPLTVEQKKDWDSFIEKHGKAFNTLEYPSMQENAEKILALLMER